MCRVGQNHIYTVTGTIYIQCIYTVAITIFIYIQCVYTVFLAGNHQIYGHKRCINMILANPSHVKYVAQMA